MPRVSVRLVIAVLAATAVVVVPGALDPYVAPKFSVMAVLVVALTAVWVATALRTHSLTIVWGAPALAALALAVAGLVVTLASENSWRSLIGARNRMDGYAMYVLVVVLFVVVASWLLEGDVPYVLMAIAGVGAFEALIGLGQAVGVNVLRETATYGPNTVLGTIGNPNFVSGVLAVCLPAALWLATSGPADRRRLLGGAAAALCVLGILASRSFQGVVAGGIGVAVPLAGAALARFRADRRRVLGILAALVVLTVSPVALGLAGRGPLAADLDDVGRTQRLRFWEIGTEMVADRPVTGLGFSRFGEYYRVYRAPEDAVYGVFESADEPHSVPLGMFVNGGLLLGVAYASFVVAIAVLVLRAMRRGLDEARRPVILATTGCWLAYQVQSVVSIDSLPLPMLHFVLAGLLVVLLGTPRVVWEAARVRGRRGRTQVPPVPWAAWSVVGGAALIASWFAIAPLRAELAARGALDAARRGDGEAALDGMRSASEALPREPTFQAETGRMLLQGNALQAALPYYERAVRQEPRSLAFSIPYARVLAATGDTAAARETYSRILDLEPNVVDLKLEVAKFELQAGDAAKAERWARFVRRVTPDNPDVYLVLGDVYRLQGDLIRSDRNYERALALRPDDLGLLGRLADTARKAGRLDRELVLRRRLVERVPSAETWDNLAIVLEKLGRRAEAIGAYQQALLDVRTDAVARAALTRLGLPVGSAF